MWTRILGGELTLCTCNTVTVNVGKRFFLRGGVVAVNSHKFLATVAKYKKVNYQLPGPSITDFLLACTFNRPSGSMIDYHFGIQILPV
jgi:hypothetical protein